VSQRYKRLDYTYDLISGNVRQVDYQAGYPDQMHHRYSYDADNRITEVETSADAVVWHRDAEYFYYPHGPLQRVELGEYKVQGMDYAYTLQGWMKGINSDRLAPGTDMGQDGLAGTANEFVGRDAYGESIGYYGDGDYSAIGSARWDNSNGKRPFAPVGDPQTGTGTLHDAYNPLYNGNIAHTVNSLQPWGGWTSPTQPAQVLAQVYRYDQLNRLKQAQGVEGLTSANTWDGVTDAVADRYKSQYTYDANGNIQSTKRWDDAGTQYDDLAYHYEQVNNKLLRNRLYHLNESINGGYGDIGVDASAFHPPHADVNLLNNYKYDELGNLIADKREEIANIEWTVSGKVKHITRTAGSTKPELWFTYGADGQRISKTVGDPLNGGYREYYLRDAQGNVMAMYKYADNGTSLKVTERPIYGSKRIGTYVRQMELMGEPAVHQWPYTQPMQAPLKRYELTDHLGNVNTVVTGRLLPLLGPGVQYQAEVVSATGYESFGFALPNRSFQSANSAWGFNGKFNDNEVFDVAGSFQDYGMRPYDTRRGQFITTDPIGFDFPWYSPYQFAGNKPIWAVDLDGLEEFIKTDYRDVAGNLYKTVIQMVSPDGVSEHIQTVHNTLVQENSDGTFTKTYTGSATGTTQGANAFGNGPLANNQKQVALNLDQNNSPRLLQFNTPKNTLTRPIGGGNPVRALANSMTLTPSAGYPLGFGANLFDSNNQSLGRELEPAPTGVEPDPATYGPTQSVFNATTNPGAYAGQTPRWDGMLGLGTNAVPESSKQRWTGTQGASDGTPIGTDFDKAQGGSGNTVP
jgi:RHS repeat-associated protein